MASGEALPPELVRQFFQRMPYAELHNLYGPIDASVDVSYWACEPEPPWCRMARWKALPTSERQSTGTLV
jgi:hypothetical protein